MKVPKPRKLKSGSWFIQLRLGGESVPVTEPTEKQCIKTAQLIKAEYLAGKRAAVPVTAPEPTLKEAIDKYIGSRSNTLSPSTIRGYYVIRNNRFKDQMDKRISEITDWQTICNDELKKKCSAKTLKNAWFFISAVIRETTGQPPARVSLPQVVIKDKLYLEPDDIPKFIKAVKGRKL